MVDTKANRLCVFLCEFLLVLNYEVAKTVDIKGFISLFFKWHGNCNIKVYCK
jgi:hypothetical protein